MQRARGPSLLYRLLTNSNCVGSSSGSTARWWARCVHVCRVGVFVCVRARRGLSACAHAVPLRACLRAGGRAGGRAGSGEGVAESPRHSPPLTYHCTHVSMHACMNACMYACMYACKYACKHVSMHILMALYMPCSKAQNAVWYGFRGLGLGFRFRDACIDGSAYAV